MGILDELKKQFQQPAQQPQQPAQQRRLNTGAQQSQPSPIAEKVNSFFNNVASKGTVVKNMPARKKLMFEPEPPKNWYSGDTPTNSEILARIATISETNPAQSKELFNQYQTFANDPTSPLYNPYKTSTNKAITELQNLGFDMSGGVTDKWINDNAWLMQYYRTETGNTPLAPTKKSSVEQNAAYWYYKILSAEETTQKAETEWQALQDEIKYWAGRTDRNYSDDEILKKIDWSNYKTLTGMDEGTAKGVPTTLNRAVGYSTDALKGVIWAARNGSTGDPTLDSVNAVLGKGKTWTKDPNVAAKLDPTSSKYSPYSVGSTLDDAALYFGVQEFSKNWLDANRAMISSDDVTEQKMYQKVYTAEQNTLKAEAELDELNKFVDAQLKYVKDPAMLAQQINDFVDENCKTLAKMDESRKSGNIMATTRAVDYRIEDIRADAIKRMNEANGKISGGEFVQKLAQNFKTNIKAMASDSAIQRWRNAAVSAAAETIMALGTDEEKIAFQNGGTADYMNFLQQIAWSMQSENPDGQAIVNDALESADTYVKENYMDAYSVVHQYDEAQQELENIQQRINELTNPYAQLPGFKYIGNIDIYNRVPVVNEDGSYSTVDSFSVNIDGREVLLPTIVDGKRVSEDEAIKHYFDTGEHLGIFDTPEEADEYAQKLHEQQERYYTHPDEDGTMSDFRATHPLPGYIIASGGASDAPMFSKDQLKPSETYENWLRYNMGSDAVQDIWNDETLSEEEMDRRTRELWAQQTGGRENVNVYDDVQLNEMPEEGAPVASDPKDQAELNALYLRQQEQQAIIDRLSAEYDAKSAILKEAQTNYEAAQKYAQVYGIDISDVGTLMDDFELAWQLGSEYVPTTWQPYSIYGQAKNDNVGHATISSAAQNNRAQCARVIGAIDELLTRLGVNAEDDSQEREQLIPDEFVENINRYKESLERDMNAATYWLMQDNKDFETLAKQAREEINKEYNGSFIIGPELKLMYQIANPDWEPDSVEDINTYVDQMTDDERNTYLYLYKSAGKDAAREYYNFLTDESYGVLTTRTNQAMQQAYTQMTQSGWLAGLGMNMMDVLVSPMRLYGTAYTAISSLQGKEINPNSKWFAASTLDSSVTQATTESITNAFGEGTTLTWLAKLAYESGKSIAESMYTGHLFGGITGGGSGILSDWVGAVPMAAEAVASAVQDAKTNGATNEQALAIGGITFFAESVSEAVTIGNLKEALNKGGTEGLKQTFMNTIKNAFTEEAPGEMFNEALESAADYWIMGENSKFNQEVERLVIEEGLSIEQAQDRALVGVVGDVLYAGLSGAVGGMMGGGVEAVASKHAYNSAVRAIQKQTGLDFDSARKILDTMESSRMTTQAEETTAQAEEAPAQETEQRTTPHNEPQAVTADDGTTAETVNTPEAETTEETVNAPEAEAAERTGVSPNILNFPQENFGAFSNLFATNAAASLTTALTADTASQTATIGAALTSEDGQSAPVARTAAQHMANSLTPRRATRVMRDMMQAVVEGGISVESAQVAITTAALNETGHAHEILNDMAQNGVTPERVNDMIREAAVESQDENVQPEIAATVRENEIAEHVKSLIADGALNGIRPMEQAVTDAKNKRRAANGALTKQVNKFNAAKQSFQEAQAAWRADPNNKDLKAAKNAARAAMKAQAEVVDEYRQRQANSEQAVTNAEDTLQHARAQVMADLRQQAQAQIAEEQAQAQAVAEQQAQEQAQAEVEAAVQADEQRQQNNAQTLDVDTFIAQAFPDATEEEKQTIRERFEAKRKEMTDPVEIRKRERFVKNLGRKFGVNIQIADTTEGGTRSRYLGSYDEGSNTITLDKGVTQTNAIYAVALHELTHMAERSGLYDQLASALTRIAYRNEDGSFNEAQLANDIRARQALYNNRLSQMGEAELTADQASKEVVADLTRKILFGDEAAINALVAEDEGVARRMLNGIKNFLNKMRGIDDPAVTQLRQTRRLFEKALKDAQKNLGNTGVGQVTDQTALAADMAESTDGTSHYGDHKQFSLQVTDQDTLDFLDNQDTITTYRAMQYIDGGLYPPMAAVVAKSKEDSSQLNHWEMAVEHPELIKSGNQFTLNKGNGKSIQAAYNPYMHSSNSMLNDQFSEAYNRPNIVVVECEVPSSEVTSGYHAEYAKDSVGWHDWHSGPIATQVRKAKGMNRQVFMSRWIKPVRVVPMSEVAQYYADLLDGTDIQVPDNVVPPSLLEELQAIGVPIKVSGKIKSAEGTPVAKNSNGETLVSEFDGGTVAKQYSLASWTEQERATVEKNLIDKGFSKADVEKWINDVDSIAATIAKDPDRLDYEADPNQTFVKPNAEYKVTIDASTLCAKRLLYQGTFNAIQRLIPNSPIKPGDLIQLVNMMKDAGHVTPCSICYVESRRRNLGTYAKQFLDSYTGENKPTLAQLTTTDGLSELRDTNPEAYDAFVKAMNKKGTSNPKVVQLRTDYRGDLRNLTKATIDYINRIGGLRFQSFSDFETPHLIDLMQAVMDGASMNLTAQAYTKVPAFAWVFGGTGIKINLSLIGLGTGLDANGNLIFDDVEGINHTEAFDIRNAYSDNVGTILVGMNDAHILAAMADPRIDFIIPFHRSGWSKADRAKMKALGEYFDYTMFQNERRLVRKADGSLERMKNGKYKTERVAEGNLYPVDYWDPQKSGKENAEIYLQKCEEEGLLPKFSRFLVDNGDGSFSLQPDGSTDGYWKLLIDYKMYNNDGQFAPQQAMQPNFNMEKAMETLNDYKGSANKLPVATDIVDQFVDWYKSEHPRTQYSLPSMDILDEQIEQYLSGGYEAFGRSSAPSDVQELRGKRTVPEVPGTVPQGTPAISPYQSAIKLADAIGVGHHFGTSKMQDRVSMMLHKPVKHTTLGYFQQRAENINVRSKEAGNYLTTMHEIWHAIGKRLNMDGTAEMIANLDASILNADYKPEELPGEAFAEFGWNYVMGDAQARAFAGDAFVDTFERAAKNAGLYDAIKQAQKEMQIWLNANINDKVKATVRNASEANKPVKGIRHLLDTIVDDTSVAEEVDAFTRKAEGKTSLGVGESLRKMSLMKNFSQRVANGLLTNKLTDSYGNEIGDSLAKRLEDAGVTGDDFDTLIQYWLFKHSFDRDREGKPVFDVESFPTAQREAFCRDIEQNHKNIVKAEKALQDFRREFLKTWLVDTGFLKEEDLMTMEATYPHYAPTMRIMDQNGGGFRGNRKGFTIRRATGGTQDIINPMDSYVSMIQSVVNMVRANKAAVLFDDLYLKNEGMGVFARDITEDMKKETVNTEGLQEKVAKIIYGKEQSVLTEEQDDVLQRVLDAIGTEQEQWKGTGKVNAPNVLTVVRYGGERVFYQINNPELYNLLASQRDNVASPLLQKVAKLTRAMSALTTGSNPVFALRNFMRDYQNSVNYGSWATNYLTGLPKWLKSAYEVWKKSGDYSDYVAQGGGGWTRIDTGTEKGISDYRGDLFKGYNTRNAAGVAKAAASSLWKLVTFEKLNEVVEQASRYAEYKYGQHDKSTWEGKAEAFLAAQDVTVDFARTGNGRFAADLKAVIPFFGASMQGVYRTARAFTEAERDRLPARFVKTVLNTAITSAICSCLLLKFTPGDDDDEKKDFLKRFAMMSDDLKAGHFYLPNFAPHIFGQAPLIRIPVGQDPLMYAVHGLMTNMIWSGSSDETVVDIKSIAGTIIDNLTPIGSTIIDPLLSLQSNKNWYGGNIVPTRMEGAHPTVQYTAETPGIFVGMSRVLDAIGNQLHTDKLSISPLKLQYIAEQYTGFLGQMAIPALSYDKNTGEIGGIMAAVNAARKRLTSDPLISNDITSSFYDGVNLMSQVMDAAKNEMPTNMLRRGLSDEEIAKANEEAQAMTKKGGIVYETKKIISDTYSKIDQINANETLTDEEKYQLTSQARRDMLDAVLDAQEQIGAWKENYVTGRNFVTDALYPGGITHNPTAYEKMPDTFKADENEQYMQLATEVYEKTGKDSALPHPSNTFKYTPKGGKQTDVTVDDAYWPAFCNQYKTAYVAKLNELIYKSGKDWGDMTDEEQLDILTKAHDKGRDKAKAWYLDYGPKN